MHLVFNLSITKMYSLSLLVSLNNRVFMQRSKDSNTITVDSYPMTGGVSTLTAASVDPGKSGVYSQHGGDRSGLQVHVHEVTLSDRERTRVGESSSVTDAKDAFEV